MPPAGRTGRRGPAHGPAAGAAIRGGAAAAEAHPWSPRLGPRPAPQRGGLHHAEGPHRVLVAEWTCRAHHLLRTLTSCPRQAARDGVDRHTAQLRVLPSGWGQQRQKRTPEASIPTSALEQLLSVGSLITQGDLLTSARAGPTTSFHWGRGHDQAGPLDMAWLLQRLAGSLEALALPSFALVDLAGYLQRQQRQQPDGPQLGLQLAAQLTRLSVLKLVCGPMEEQPLDAGSWAFVNALPALRHLHVWGNSADEQRLPAGLETLVLSAYLRNTPTLLEATQGLTSLRALGLRDCRLSAERLAQLAACTRLTALDISGNELASLGPIAGLTSLKGARVWGAGARLGGWGREVHGAAPQP
jgi:hypothetical protein